MSRVSLEDIVEIIQTELNDLSDTLFNDSTITTNIKFRLAAENQEDDEKIYSSTVITPGIVRRVSGSIQSNSEYEAFNNIVVVEVYGFNEDKDDLDTILNEYAFSNSGKQFTLNTWKYVPIFELPQFNEVQIDEGTDRIQANLIINYEFTVNGVTADEMVVTINGTSVPVLSISDTISKSGTSDEIVNRPGEIVATNLQRSKEWTFSFLYNDNIAIRKVFEDIKEGKLLNEEYTIGIVDPYQGTDTFLTVLTNGSYGFNIVNNQRFVTIEATFTESRGF